MTSIVPTLAAYAQQGLLVPRYQNFPFGRYVTLLLARRTESETVFRTEGSGEGLVKEAVRAGRQRDEVIWRIVMSKRKQTAVERRTGRELLREHGYLKTKENRGGPVLCALNTNSPCEHCIDCLLYGFAVGGGGAQKSRVLTSDAFSLAATADVVDTRTSNATYDNGTMRNPLTGQPSTALYEEEYVKPEAHFLDMETLKDVMPGELAYVIGNILRSRRYGAVSSRIGRMRNSILAIVFSDCELCSNLELTQTVYDRFVADGGELPFPLADHAVATAATAALLDSLGALMGRTPTVVQGADLDRLLAEVRAVYADPQRLTALLTEIEAGYPKAG
ncbi:MAG: type I-D CRISPR-associated protein Cas7/Csc2 [Chloroflexi bacterium]|nr:type I-D CRISPR-associated protein Cas7/Csc2 [Chloroflexota bacterium]